MANTFPRWTNLLPLKLVVCLGILATAIVAGIWYYFTPAYTRVGYQPVQPVAFSHDIHANQLGMDCRYCHSFVEVAAHSNIPSTQTCMNCHSQVQKENPKLAAVRESWNSGKPIEWVQIHKTPGFAYFNHSVHVNRGVSCVSCHGQINRMPTVFHAKPFSMSFCLDCHRNPENALRPKADVFNLDWRPDDLNVPQFLAKYGKPPGMESKEAPTKLTQKEIGLTIAHKLGVNAPVANCAGCHR